MATGRFGKYSLLIAGNCNYGNFSDLPEIHQEKMEGLPVTDSGLAPSKWGAGKESQCVRGVTCFRILLYKNISIYMTELPPTSKKSEALGLVETLECITTSH
jgi:hypothetical protein